MLALAILTLTAAGVSVGLAIFGFAAPRRSASARVQQIGAYGYSGGLALTGTDARRRRASGHPLVALAALLGALVARRVGPVREEKLRSELLAAGVYGVAPRVLLGSAVLSAISFGAVGLAYDVASPILKFGLVVLLVRIGWGAPLFVVRRRARTRLDTIDRTLPDLIDLLVVTVEAGLGFASSLQVAATRLPGPLGNELRLTLAEHRMGRGLEEALGQMLERAETPAMRSFVRAVTQGEALGVSIGTILRGLSIEMRRRRRQLAEERAQKAPVKMLFPLVFLIFPSIGIVVLGPAVFEVMDALGGV